jgi:dienelactone hydrolase
MRTVLAAIHCLLVAASAVAAVRTETLDYTVGDTPMKGFLAYDDSTAGKRPGVLVVHEWWGLNDYARERAKRLAESGYVAFALDMYGGGKSTTHPEEAGQWSGAIRAQQDLGRARFQAAYDLLRADPRVAPAKIAAVGSCFGGSVVLAMAEAGADLAGVVSYHGALPAEPVAAGTAVKAKILAFHGSADPFVPVEQVATFQRNLDAAGADWQFVTFGGVQHSFTNPDADRSGVPGLAYDADADRRSWRATLDFFHEVFGE